MTDADLVAVLQRNGWGGAARIEPLGVTGNNHVRRAEIHGRIVLVKEYFQHAADPRDRFSTERAFYSFISEAGISAVPEPIAWHPEERLALLEFVQGDKPQRATAEFVRQAIEFFVELNRHRELNSAKALPLASEACFTIGDHLACVDRRVDRLTKIAADSDLHHAAIEFVGDRLKPTWQRLRDDVAQRSEMINAPIREDERCVSPSDFGFHNSICARDGRLRFFDFEYAGWDDPAKAVCDFFCQPAVPVPRENMPTFLDAISDSLGGADLVNRASLLMPVYQTKWCCIMLNDFLPAGDSRRAFSNPQADDGVRRKRQLDKAVAFHRAVFP